MLGKAGLYIWKIQGHIMGSRCVFLWVIFLVSYSGVVPVSEIMSLSLEPLASEPRSWTIPTPIPRRIEEYLTRNCNPVKGLCPQAEVAKPRPKVARAKSLKRHTSFEPTRHDFELAIRHKTSQWPVRDYLVKVLIPCCQS